MFVSECTLNLNVTFSDILNYFISFEFMRSYLVLLKIFLDGGKNNNQENPISNCMLTRIGEMKGSNY